MSGDPAGREAGPGRSEGPVGTGGGLAAAFVGNTVDDGPPGLEPTLGSLRRALDEIEGALAATGEVRAALTDLAAGSPGDDRVLVSFLRTRLSRPDARLLEILAGISEEHRALLRAEAEILAIYERPPRDPILALERLAATTKEHRTLPVATYVAPGRKQVRGALGALGSLVGGRDGPPAAGPRSGASRPAPDRGSAERGSAFGWLSSILRPPAPSAPRETATADDAHAAPGASGSAPSGWTAVDGPSGSSADADREPVAPPAFLDAADRAGPASRDEPEGPADEPVGPPAFLEVAPAALPAPVAPAVPDDEAGEATRASAIALPTATTGYGTRATRPRGTRTKPRSAGSGGRRIAGFGLAIVIPAAAAMWVSGFQSTGTASAGDGAAVAAATSPTTSLAPASVPPITTAKDNPDVIPLGDDHGTSGFPIGTEPPVMAPILPVVTDPETVKGVTLAFRGPTDRKVVALTFDDGYAPPNTRTIFETLVRENVKATFFINGYYLSRDPALWKEIADAGFPVGNHTYYHVDIRTLDAAAIKQEIRMTSSAWKRVTGGRMIPYFRPPYGARTAETDAAVAAAGYRHIVMWDASSADTKAGISDAQATASALAGGPGSIVLLHAGPDVTPRILQAVIDGYRSRGFEFVTIPELLGT